MSDNEQAQSEEKKSPRQETTEIVTKKSTKKRRPARVQVDPSTVREDDRPPQTGSTFNIWYLKW